jgi:hypothetical protein
MVTTAPSAFERAAQRAFDALFGHRFDEFKTQLAEGTDLEGHANNRQYDDFERFPALYYIFRHPELPNAKELWTLLRAHGADIDDKLDDGRETTFRARLQLEAAENPVLRAVIGDDFCALG